MRKYLLLTLITVFAAVATYLHFFKSSVDLPLRSIEKKMGLDGEHNWQFHRVLEDKERHGFRFPGYLIGIEKASQELLELDQQKDVFQTAMLSSSTVSTFRDIFNDSNRLFLSHMVKYDLSLKKLPRISSEVLYSVYDDFTEDSSTIPFGQEALKSLLIELTTAVSSGGYTHVLVISMGWNTPQLEAIGDMNSLVGQLMAQVEKEGGHAEFKPVVIGVTWPSISSVADANYISKAYDADELGLVWINRLISEILLPIKEQTGVKILMLGHSLGARALSMGLFAANWSGHNTAEHIHVDAMIGYEPAFSINRFIPDEGIENSPYANFRELGTQFVFTWSKHDLAMRMGSLYLTSHMGSEDAASEAKQYPQIFQSVSLEEDVSLQTPIENNKVLHIDASLLLKHQTHQSSGGAHSDIFRAELAATLWQLIKKIELEKTP